MQSLDIEYRFDDKMLTPSNSKHEKWRKMTFGKGGATFMSDSRVKLPFLKPNVFGMINYFLTEVCSVIMVFVFDGGGCLLLGIIFSSCLVS